MVRIGTLPTRLLALRYGADYVFSPETVDKKLIQCAREYDPATGMVDYVKYAPGSAARRQLVLRLHSSEKPRLVVQLGTADPDTALQAALMLQSDAAGIDINCGCPKRFSTHAGMGAALLKQPDLLCSILSGLCRGQSLPVSCKIRLLPDIQDTLRLVHRIAHTGVHAITVHGRTAHQQYDCKADWAAVSLIRQAVPRDIAVVLNGDILSRPDIHRALADSHCDSVMLARAAQHNLSIFGRTGADLPTVSLQYLQLAMDMQNSLSNTKYCLLQSWADCQPKTEAVKETLRRLYAAKTYADLFLALGHPQPVSHTETPYEHDEDVEFGYTAQQQEARLAGLVCP